MPEFSPQDLKHILNGAGFFGSGGGGAIASGQQVLETMKNPVRYLSADEAIQEARETNKSAAIAAYIGAPDSMMTIHEPKGAINAVIVLDNVTHKPDLYAPLLTRCAEGTQQIKYIAPVEVGPLNSITACAVASDLGMTVVDVDGAGRAVPALPMLAYSYADGLPPSPAVLATDKEEAVSIHVPTPEEVESFARPIISLNEYQSKAGLAMWTMDPQQMQKAFMVKDTLVLSKVIGEILADSRTPVESACEYLKDKAGFETAEIFFTGKITKVESDLGEGFDDGRVILKSTIDSTQLYVYFKNENIIAWQSGRQNPVAIAPDLISYVTEKGQAFTNADIKVEPDGRIRVLDEIDPTVHMVVISANPHLQKSVAWEPIKNEFEQLLVSMGYPLSYMSYQQLMDLH